MTPAKAIPFPAGGRWLGAGSRRLLTDMAVPVAVLGIVIALITPLPGFVLDLLIVIDILMSTTVLMVSLYLVRPVEFTAFPTTLLLLTLFRLALKEKDRNSRQRAADRSGGMGFAVWHYRRTPLRTVL